MSPIRLYEIFSIREEDAVEYVKRVFWQDGIVCPYQESKKHKEGVKRGSLGCTSLRGARTKLGYFQCKACRRIFSVRKGTPFEESHLSLATWLAAIHLRSRVRDLYPAYLVHTVGIRTHKTAKMVLDKVTEIMGRDENKKRFSGLGKLPTPDTWELTEAHARASRRRRAKGGGAGV